MPELSSTGGRPLSTYILKLYVTGASSRAATAIANLRQICDEELDGKYQLDIIDVLEHPELAESDRILATPTLIKQLPPPLRRVIGDLSDRGKVLIGLEVRSSPSASAATPSPRGGSSTPPTDFPRSLGTAL
jgi:circadian clock protein KaiB